MPCSQSYPIWVNSPGQSFAGWSPDGHLWADSGSPVWLRVARAATSPRPWSAHDHRPPQHPDRKRRHRSASSSPAPCRRSPRPARRGHGAAPQPAATARSRRWWTTRTGMLALPPGFRYRVVTTPGKTKLDDGQGPTPSNHDGTAVFNAPARPAAPDPEPRARRRLGARRAARRGHRLRPRRARTAAAAPSSRPTAAAATSASGSASPAPLTNCAGGPTPWGTWLTCEETETKAGTAWTGGGQSGTYQQDHGYVFEVFADGTSAPQADQGVRPLRPRGAARSTRSRTQRLPVRGRQQPERAVLPLDRAARRHARRRHRRPARRHRRHARGDGDHHGRRRRCCPTSPTSPRPSSAGRSR